MYLFDDLMLGETYTIEVVLSTLPASLQDGSAYDPDGGADSRSTITLLPEDPATPEDEANNRDQDFAYFDADTLGMICLLYTSPSPRD